MEEKENEAIESLQDQGVTSLRLHGDSSMFDSIGLSNNSPTFDNIRRIHSLILKEKDQSLRAELISAYSKLVHFLKVKAASYEV